MKHLRFDLTHRFKPLPTSTSQRMSELTNQNLHFLVTFLLKSVLPLYICFEILYFLFSFLLKFSSLCTFLLKPLLSLYFSMKISAFSSPFYWNLFLFTFPENPAPPPATQCHLEPTVKRRLAICNCDSQCHNTTASEHSRPYPQPPPAFAPGNSRFYCKTHILFSPAAKHSIPRIHLTSLLFFNQHLLFTVINSEVFF